MSEEEKKGSYYGQSKGDQQGFSQPDFYDESLESDIDHGVKSDSVYMRRVLFWVIFGIIVFVVVLYGVYQMYVTNKFFFQERAGTAVEFREVNELNRQAQQQLQSAGELDGEEGIYHIPIDSAINIYVREQQEE